MKKRKTRIALLTILFLLFGCEENVRLLFKETDTLEYGESPLSLVASSNVEELSYVWIDLNGNPIAEEALKIGEKAILVVDGSKGNRSGQWRKEVILEDTTAPTVRPQTTELVLEYGEEIDYARWVEETFTVSDNYSSVSIDFSQLSSTRPNTAEIYFRDEAGNITTAIVQITLRDTSPPTITAEKTNFVITEGEPLPDFARYAAAWDKKDGELPILVENECRSDRPGTYSLLFTAVDTSGNKAQLPFTCVVLEKTQSAATAPPVSMPNSFSDSTGNEANDDVPAPSGPAIRPGSYQDLAACQIAAEQACAVSGYLCVGSDEIGWIYECN